MTTRRQLAALLAAACAVGCTVDAGPEDAAPSPTAERVAEVRAAREALAEPVPAVVTAADVVLAGAERARAGAAADAGSGGPRVPGVEALEEARAALVRVTVEGDGPDVVAARAAVADVVDAAAELARAVRDEQAARVELADVEDRLVAARASWDEPGSRSQQLARLDEIAAEVGAIVERLGEEGDGATSCVGPRQRLRDAAALVAERTAQLRDHAERRDGAAFDEARAAFDADPALGAPSDAAAVCWESGSAVVAPATRLDDAVERLEDALNPSDLTRGSGGG